MRKLLFLLPFTLFIACENVGKYAETIQSLSGDWSSTSEAVTGLMGNITETQGDISQMLSEMAIGEDLQSSLEQGVLDQLAGFRDQVSNQGAGLTGLLEKVNTFKGEWEEKAETLQEIKDQLETGKVPEGIEESLNSIRETIASGQTSVSEWEPQLEKIQTDANSAFDQFTELLDSVTTE